jgi:hypothetical protein
MTINYLEEARRLLAAERTKKEQSAAMSNYDIRQVYRAPEMRTIYGCTDSVLSDTQEPHTLRNGLNLPARMKTPFSTLLFRKADVWSALGLTNECEPLKTGDFVPVGALATMLDIAPETVRRAIERGEIPGFRIRTDRIVPSDAVTALLGDVPRAWPKPDDDPAFAVLKERQKALAGATVTAATVASVPEPTHEPAKEPPPIAMWIVESIIGELHEQIHRVHLHDVDLRALRDMVSQEIGLQLTSRANQPAMSEADFTRLTNIVRAAARDGAADAVRSIIASQVPGVLTPPTTNLRDRVRGTR